MDSGKINLVPHFDVVAKLATDHHYHLKAKQSKVLTNATSPVYLNIMKEWKILKGKNTLPDSIYVQAYETRIDLMRAVIVGSPGTPYHNGLFFFDICLPSDYPNQPPKVHYISHGYRLNPNLYANGMVCISLINTWFGAEVEKWTPNSTILQTLVSIQGLVLNERPYFNEPGIAHQKNNKVPGVVNASIGYNQRAFTLTCKSMLHIMQKPPQNFEDFVARHFRDRAGLILAAVREYEKGRMVMPSDLKKILSQLEIAFSRENSGKENAVIPVKEKEIVKKKQRKGILSQLKNFAKCIILA